MATESDKFCENKECEMNQYSTNRRGFIKKSLPDYKEKEIRNHAYLSIQTGKARRYYLCDCCHAAILLFNKGR